MIVPKYIIPRTGVLPVLRMLNETLPNRICVNVAQLLIEKYLTFNCHRMITLLPDSDPACFFIQKHPHPEEAAELTLLAQETLDLLAGVALEIADNTGNLIGVFMTDDGVDVTGHDHVRVNFQPLVGLAIFETVQDDLA